MPPSRFDVLDTALLGLKIIQRRILEDERGSLSRIFCAETFREAGFMAAVNQINHTHTKRAGTVRGLHFQNPPHAEVKVVSCLKGRIFDVAVDLRCGSPTFLQWLGVVLSADNRTSLLVPEGFAHGFQTLAEDCELLYLHSAPYCPEAEEGLHPADPRLGIAWPRKILHLSDRDQGHPFVLSQFQGLLL